MKVNSELNQQAELLTGLMTSVDGAANRTVSVRSRMVSYIKRGGNCCLYVYIVSAVLAIVVLLIVT